MITRFFGTPRLVVRTSLAMFAVVTIVLTAITRCQLIAHLQEDRRPGVFWLLLSWDTRFLLNC